MKSLIYTTVVAVLVIFALSQSARLSSYTGSAPVAVVSQDPSPGAEVPAKPLPVEQWDAF